MTATQRSSWLPDALHLKQRNMFPGKLTENERVDLEAEP